MKTMGIALGAVLLSAIGAARAAGEEPAFSVGKNMAVRDVLSAQVGKPVVLRLRAGEEIGGKVQTVGDQVVHLSEVAGRDFYDAVVRLDGVDAVLVRVRGR
jgi:hypothetical protein